MSGLIKISGLVSILLILNGCIATAPEINADAVKNEGLLVAHLGSRSTNPGRTNVVINGEEYEFAIRDRYLRLPLKPGTYQFEKIVEKSSYRSGNITTNNTLTLPVKFKFTIQAGRVTNVGEMVFHFPSANSKKYISLYIDNTDEMKEFIKKSHPDVYATLRSKKFIKANVKYLNKKQIKAIRTLMLRTARISPAGYVEGNLGSFAKVIRDNKGKPKNIKFYNTGTFKKIGPCAKNKSRHICVVPHAKKGQILFNATRNKVDTNKLPTNKAIALIQFVGDKDIIIATNQMEVYTSTNKGKNWTSHLQSKSEKPLKQKHHPRILFDSKGYYVYSRGEDAEILYRKYSSKATYKIIKPPEDEDLNIIYSTDKGLYTDPEYTVFGDGAIYFQAKGQKEWQERIIPSSSCYNLKVLNRKSDKVAAKCSSTYWITENQGKSWRKAKKNEVKR